MNARLYKEYRALRPFWVWALFLPLAPCIFFSEKEPAALFFTPIGYVFGCLLLGTVSFGSELNHQTMDLLLAQPISRRRLWREKMGILGVALVSVALVFVVPWLLLVPPEARRIVFSPQILIWIAVPVAWALGVAPLLTLWTGNVLAAFVFSWGSPFAWVLLINLFMPTQWGTVPIDMESVRMLSGCLYALPLILIAGVGYRSARFRFQQFETTGFGGKTIRLPDWLSFPIKSSAGIKAPDAGGPLRRLVHKEFRVHEVSDMIAGGALLLSIVLVTGRWVSSLLESPSAEPWLKVDLVGPVVMILGLIIPLITGAAAVAEERQMGLLEWHLTLPPSRRQQWLVKIMVAYGHAIALGILLPAAIYLTVAWLSAEGFPQWMFNYGQPPVFYSLCASVLLTTIALFASSFAKSSLRAILVSLGTIALAWAIAVAVSYQFPDVQRSVADIISDGVLDTVSSWTIKYWLLGATVVGAYGFILIFGYLNFRRPDVRLGPIAQIGLVSILVALLMGVPTTYIAFQRADELEQASGLSGPGVRALRRGDKPQLMAEIAVLLEDPAKASHAAKALEYCRCRGPIDLLPLLAQALTNRAPEVRLEACYGLFALRNNLTNQIELDSVLAKRYQLASSIYVFPPSSELEQAMAVLYQKLQDPDTAVRAAAVTVLAEKHYHSEKLVPALIEMLIDSQSPNSLRMDIVLGLGRLGTEAKAAIPELLKIAGKPVTKAQPDITIRRAAQKALKQIDPDLVLPGTPPIPSS